MHNTKSRPSHLVLEPNLLTCPIFLIRPSNVPVDGIMTSQRQESTPTGPTSGSHALD